jgi:hypothetical protein
MVPGIFFKFDIEPLSLTVTEYRTPFYQFFVRLINVMGGVLVSGNWMYKLSSLFSGFFRRGRRRAMDGMINGRVTEEHDD